MKVLVTGATSGLGRNAVQRLLEMGFEVVATGRNRAEGQRLKKIGASFTALDLTQASQEQCSRLMEGCDAVWHCAAKSSPWGDSRSFYLANVQATRTLVQAAGDLQIPRFVHISTPALYFDFQHHYDLSENYLARSFACHYAESKYQAEQAISDVLARFAHTTFIILRPRGLFGPFDQVIVPRLLQQLARGSGVLRLPRGGQVLLDLTFVQNVVHAMELATVGTRLQSGSIYNVTNHEPRRLADMLDALLRQQLGLRYQIQSLPWPMLSVAARGLELLGRCLHREPPITRYSAATVCFDMTLSSRKAVSELGYQPRFSMEQGIALTAEWLRTHGKNQRI